MTNSGERSGDILGDRNALLEFHNSMSKIKALEAERNIKMWEAMSEIRANELLRPVERFALGLFGTSQALQTFQLIHSRIYDTVGQQVVGMGHSAKGDTFVYGESTGQLVFRDTSDARGAVGGVLSLLLGKTFSSVNPDRKIRVPAGAVHDSYELEIHKRWIPSGTADLYSRGLSAPEDEVFGLPVNLYGNRELLNWSGVNEIADLVTNAQAALDGKMKPDYIFWNP